MSTIRPPLSNPGNGQQPPAGQPQQLVESVNPLTGEVTTGPARDAYAQAMGGGRAALAVGAAQAMMMAAEKQAIVKAQYEMARMYPRDWNMVRQRVLLDCQRYEFAEEAVFSKPMGKTKDKTGQWVANDVTGLSIRFAEAAMRHSGNFKYGRRQVDEDRYWVRYLLTIEDLESQTISEEEITVSKTVERKVSGDRQVVMERTNSYGDKVFVCLATEDELRTKSKAETQKTKRQLILEMLPADLKAEARRVIDDTRRKGASAPDAKKKLMDAFFAVGVSARDIGEYLGHTLDTVQPAELIELRDMYNAIKDGETTWQAVVEARPERGAGNAPAINTPPASPSTQTVEAQPSSSASDADALLADVAAATETKALDALTSRMAKLDAKDPRRAEVAGAIAARRKALLAEKK